MDVQMKHACGLDVHQATVVACLLSVLDSGKVKKQIRSFGTTTRELQTLREWLLAHYHLVKTFGENVPPPRPMPPPPPSRYWPSEGYGIEVYERNGT